jgi:hypothetical protein
MHYELFIALFAGVLLPIYFFLPESPRWLYSVGRTQDCAKSLAAILQFNGQNANESSILAKLNSKKVKQIEQVRNREY